MPLSPAHSQHIQRSPSLERNSRQRNRSPLSVPVYRTPSRSEQPQCVQHLLLLHQILLLYPEPSDALLVFMRRCPSKVAMGWQTGLSDLQEKYLVNTMKKLALLLTNLKSNRALICWCLTPCSASQGLRGIPLSDSLPIKGLPPEPCQETTAPLPMWGIHNHRAESRS